MGIALRAGAERHRTGRVRPQQLDPERIATARAGIRAAGGREFRGLRGELCAGRADVPARCASAAARATRDVRRLSTSRRPRHRHAQRHRAASHYFSHRQFRQGTRSAARGRASQAREHRWHRGSGAHGGRRRAAPEQSRARVAHAGRLDDPSQCGRRPRSGLRQRTADERDARGIYVQARLSAGSRAASFLLDQGQLRGRAGGLRAHRPQLARTCERSVAR